MRLRSALLAVALLPVVGCGDRGAQAPPAPVRLLEGDRSIATWPAAAGSPPEFVLPVEVGSVPLPGRAGRVVMAAAGDGADGRDGRVALLAPAGSRYRASLVLPAGDPVLRLALGYVPESTPPGAGLRFQVELTPAAGGAAVVLDETLTAAKDGRWADREVPLAHWAGERVVLELRVGLAPAEPADPADPAGRTDPADPPPPWAAWGEPEVFARGERPEAWNVVLVVLDTLRADHLGCYGYPRATSPHLDALAARSIRFATAVSQAPWTRPSHRSLFSGLYPLSQGDLSSPPLAEVLWENGYRTQAITGGAQLAYRFGFSRGFERHAIQRWVRSIDSVVETLEADRFRKHFLFLHTYEIHDPYEHRELTAGLDPGRVGAVFRRAVIDRLRRDLTPDERAYVTALYDSGIAYTDAQLGLLLDRLEERGLLDRTLLVVTSDHGEELWDHGLWGHGRAMFDEQSRVPLIVHLPRAMAAELGLRERPRVIERQVRLVDLYPTILDLLSIPLDHRIHGRSLRPLLAGGRLAPVDAFSEWTYWGPVEVKALRGERYKYFRGTPKEPDDSDHAKWEALFDLVQDPDEMVDIREAAPDVLVRMRTLVDRIVGAGSNAPEEQVPADLDPELESQLRALGYVE